MRCLWRPATRDDGSLAPTSREFRPISVHQCTHASPGMSPEPSKGRDRRRHVCTRIALSSACACKPKNWFWTSRNGEGTSTMETTDAGATDHAHVRAYQRAGSRNRAWSLQPADGRHVGRASCRLQTSPGQACPELGASREGQRTELDATRRSPRRVTPAELGAHAAFRRRAGRPRAPRAFPRRFPGRAARRAPRRNGPGLRFARGPPFAGARGVDPSLRVPAVLAVPPGARACPRRSQSSGGAHEGGRGPRPPWWPRRRTLAQR